MKTLISFGVFIFVIVVIVAIVGFSITGIMIFSAVVIALMIGAGIYDISTNSGSALGFIVGEVGRNNNIRLGIMILLTLMTFVFAFKYGAGEPVMVSLLHDTKEAVVAEKDNKLVKEINHLLWGDKKSSKPEMTGEKEKSSKSEMTGEKEKTPKTWFFWKLFVVFFFITLFYVPFAFADEIVELLGDLAIKVRNMRDEIKNQVKPPEPQVSTVSGTVKTTASGTNKFGWFAKLYGSDLAAEFTMRVLQNAAKMFSRV